MNDRIKRKTVESNWLIEYTTNIKMGFITMASINDIRPVAKSFTDGLLTGIISTAVFNPVDRALYLMVKESKPINDPSLWKTPYQGVGQAVYSRVVGYGVYFTFNDIYRNFLRPHGKSVEVLGASMATGLTTVALNHPINVVKMYAWSHKCNDGLIAVTQQLTRTHGWSVFLRAIHYTCLRDMAFSMALFKLSDKYNNERSILKDTAIASFATFITSPVNYMRNRAFFDFKAPPVSFEIIATELYTGIREQPSLWDKTSFLFLKKFNVGFGTLRVGLGMAMAKKIYETLKDNSYMGVPNNAQ
jgi:hypothetical protein